MTTPPHDVPAWAQARSEDGTPFWIAPIDKRRAREVTIANHYSKTWNDGLFGLYCFGVHDPQGLAGAIVFGRMQNPASWASVADLSPEGITELNRMWIDDRLGPNTETAALSRCMRWLRHHSPAQLVQTFADGRLGCGTVYKAANFGYYGYDESVFFDRPATKQTYHCTPFSNTRQARAMVARNHLLVTGQLRAFSVRTYRYLYPLTRYAGRRIVLERQPYPAYHRGQVDLPDYLPPASQLARCVVIADALGYVTEAADLRAYLAEHYDPAVVAEAMHVAGGNDWISPIVAEAEAQPDLLGLLDSTERVA